MDNQKNKKNTKQEKLNIKKLSEELEIVRKERDEFKNKYLRALADYQNYERRVIEEKRQQSEELTANFVLKLLPFLDHLEKAEIFVKDQGLKMIKDKFYNILSELGLEETQMIDKPFDPHFAEAIEVIEGKEDNIVKEVLRKGYRYNGRVLRVAQVKVSKKITNSNQQDTNKL